MFQVSFSSNQQTTTPLTLILIFRQVFFMILNAKLCFFIRMEINKKLYNFYAGVLVITNKPWQLLYIICWQGWVNIYNVQNMKMQCIMVYIQNISSPYLQKTVSLKIDIRRKALIIKYFLFFTVHVTSWKYKLSLILINEILQ